jgi:hypothetical protein
VYEFVLLATPPTVICTGPLITVGGTLATIWVSVQLTIEVAVVPLNVTLLVPCVAPNPVPVMVTCVPVGPDVGDIGLRADAIVQEADLKLTSSRRFRIPVMVMRLEDVSKLYGVKVDGLVGQDVLSRYGKISIDYQSKTIELGE